MRQRLPSSRIPHWAAVRRALPAFAPALREALRDGYGRRELMQDLWAGLSVGVIALPLSLALAIASGVPPQHGLYTAIVAGAVAALAGGSRYSVSGPTAAFVVILHPIAVQYGVAGLLLATLMAGAMLIALGWGRMGQLIQYIPYPVTTGFTAGIAVVIASLQLQDFFGLTLAHAPEHFSGRMLALAGVLGSINPAAVAVSLTTLAVMALWPRLRTPVPAYLIGALTAGLMAFALRKLWPQLQLPTIADRFSYLIDGVRHAGIPNMVPQLQWPWQIPGDDGQPLHLSFHLLRELTPPAFAIAILGAIESLLCAVIADGMTGKKHDPNAELVAQGLGNLLAPLFGGIPATGALARTAANIRAGAQSPIAAAVHAAFVLVGMLALAPLLSQLPMAGLAALLMVVAWNMSERRKFWRVLRQAPREDVLLLLSCFGLTVLLDMVVAISVGVVLAALLFMHRMAKVSQVRLLAAGDAGAPVDLPSDVRVYSIAGPLFFGAAERAVETLRRYDRGMRSLILDLSAVPTIDITGLVALEGVIDELNGGGIYVVLSGAQRNVLGALRDAGYRNRSGALWYCRSMSAAAQKLKSNAVVDASSAEPQTVPAII